jgi:hypothetical protein
MIWKEVIMVYCYSGISLGELEKLTNCSYGFLNMRKM